MVRVHLQDLRPGMVLARPVKDAEGRLLLGAGTVLRLSYIRRLQELGLASVFIRDGVADDVEPEWPVSEETRAQTVTTVAQVFAKLAADGQLPSLEPLHEAVENLLDELLAHPGVLLGLTEIRTSDSYTFSHSVDVCVMSLLIGRDLGFNRARLHDLGMGALLHDIGKVRVPAEILKKPDKLTPEEFEEMKRHTTYGFEILRARRDLSLLSAHVAYQHHERNDGSGYPRGLTVEAIHPLAQVVAVADVFDAMTTDRVYRPGLSFDQAARELVTMVARQQLDASIVQALLNRLAIYPTGVVVRLNTGELAVVVGQGPGTKAPHAPVVRVFVDPRGCPLPSPREIDLRHDPIRRIRGVIRWAPGATVSPLDPGASRPTG